MTVRRRQPPHAAAVALQDFPGLLAGVGHAGQLLRIEVQEGPAKFFFAHESFSLQKAPQRLFAVVDSRADGAELAADDARDLFVAHLFQKPQHEHLALLRRQLVERRVNPRGVLRREFALFAAAESTTLASSSGCSARRDFRSRP